MRSEAEMRTELRAFVSGKAKGADIADDTPLFTLRLLRSVHLPELILLLERLRGAPIDLQALQPGDFGCIDSMVRHFGGTR